MKTLAPVTLFFLFFMQVGCRENYTYPELKNVSEIVVMDSGNPIKKVDDPVVISKIVEFINNRNDGWDTPITGFPSTKVKLSLYRNGEFIGSFGITESSFSMQRGGRWDAKPAASQEVQELINILGVEKTILK